MSVEGTYILMLTAAKIQQNCETIHQRFVVFLENII